MGFKTVFKNFGHAIAIGAKYIAIGVKDVVLVANKAQAVAPEVELLVGALAGPIGVKATDIAFHLLGDVANALAKTGADAGAVADDATGINLQLDTALVNDIKALVPVLAAIIKATGGQIPPAK